MDAAKELLDKNPLTTGILLGVVVTLIIVAIIYYIFYSENEKLSGGVASELAYLQGVSAEHPIEKLGEPAYRPVQKDPPQVTGENPDPRFFAMSMEGMEHMNDGADKDDAAMELLQGRGTAHRPIGDSAKSRYLGLAQTLGGGDYEGVYDKYQGYPVSDEFGTLVSQVYGINGTPGAEN